MQLYLFLYNYMCACIYVYIILYMFTYTYIHVSIYLCIWESYQRSGQIDCVGLNGHYRNLSFTVSETKTIGSYWNQNWNRILHCVENRNLQLKCKDQSGDSGSIETETEINVLLWKCFLGEVCRRRMKEAGWGMQRS